MRRISRIASRFDRFFGQFSAARACAAAVEAGRRPPEKSLRTLGINPSAFRHLG